MSLDDRNKEFIEKYLINTDNIYDAINQYIDDANELQRNSNNLISDSESLSIVLTDTYPKNYRYRKLYKEVEDSYVSRYIKSTLSEVDDVQLKHAVSYIVDASRLNRSLKLDLFNDFDLSEGQKARGRILSKIIWENICIMKRGQKMEEIKTPDIEVETNEESINDQMVVEEEVKPKRSRRGRPRKKVVEEVEPVEESIHVVEECENNGESLNEDTQLQDVDGNLNNEIEETKIEIETAEEISDINDQDEKVEEILDQPIEEKNIQDVAESVTKDNQNLLLVSKTIPVYSNVQCTNVVGQVKGSVLIVKDYPNSYYISYIIGGLGRGYGYIKK